MRQRDIAEQIKGLYDVKIFPELVSKISEKNMPEVNARQNRPLESVYPFIFINHPKYCWCEKGIRPSVPCHHIREYRYAYGAVEPLTGESCFLVMPYCNTACINLFLRELSKQFPQDTILMCCDGAAWHKSGTLEVPDTIS